MFYVMRWVVVGMLCGYALIADGQQRWEKPNGWLWQVCPENKGSPEWLTCVYQLDREEISASQGMVQRDRGKLCINPAEGGAVCFENNEDIRFLFYTYQGRLPGIPVGVVLDESFDARHYTLISLVDGSQLTLGADVKLSVSPQGGYVAAMTGGEAFPLRQGSYDFVAKIYEVKNGRLVEDWSMSSEQWHEATEGVPWHAVWDGEQRLRIPVLNAEVLNIKFEGLSEQDLAMMHFYIKSPEGWRVLVKTANGWQFEGE